MQLELTVPVPISINHLYINQYSWRKDKKTGIPIKIPTGKRILSKEGIDWKKRVVKSIEQQMKNQKWDYEKTKEKYIYIDYIAFMNRKRRDTDNLNKLLQDTLADTKQIFIDDTRVLTRPNKVFIDRESPRLELKIKFVDFVGVFDNEKQLGEFIQNCKKCTRFRKGSCSILKDCIEGVINKDFDFIHKECNKFKEKK